MTRRYVIIGAGAVGGAIGALLSSSGTDAVLVARGEHLEAMRRDGLRLRLPESDAAVPVTAISGPDEIDLTADDVLVLATKTHQAEQALRLWADAPAGGSTAGESLPILTALNGVSAEAMALRWFRRVIGVCVWMPALRLDPGEVFVPSSPLRAIFPIGRFPAGAADAEDARLIAAIREDWASAGMDVLPVPDVMPWKHRKLLANLGNAVQALLGTGDEEIVAAARAEARQVLAHAGIALNGDEEEAENRARLRSAPVPGQPERRGGSTWQSLARGTGETEADYLNGQIVAIARAHGLDAPINAAIARLTRRAARDGARPGDMSPQELRAALPL